MRQRILVALMVLPVMFLSALQAQVSFKLGGGGGVVLPMGDYGGTLADYYAGSKYGLATGFGVHAKARVGLLGFNLTGEIGYSFLSNDGSPEGGNSNGEVSHQVLSIKVGPEYQVGLPAVPVTPYFGANVALNMFSGSSKFQGTSKLTSNEIDLASSSRIGIGATVGVMISSIDVAVHYNLMNLTGRSWAGGDDRRDTYSSLNDDKDPAYAPADDKHVVSAARSIQAVAVTVSFMFGL